MLKAVVNFLLNSVQELFDLLSMLAHASDEQLLLLEEMNENHESLRDQINHICDRVKNIEEQMKVKKCDDEKKVYSMKDTEITVVDALIKYNEVANDPLCTTLIKRIRTNPNATLDNFIKGKSYHVVVAGQYNSVVLRVLLEALKQFGPDTPEFLEKRHSLERAYYQSLQFDGFSN